MRASHLKASLALPFLLLASCEKTPDNLLVKDEDQSQISEEQLATESLQAAEQALESGHPELAQDYLGKLEALPESERVRQWDISAQIEGKLGRSLAALELRFKQMRAAQGTDWEAQSTHDLWSQLISLPPKSLYPLLDGSMAERKPWLTLALHWKTLSHKPQTLKSTLNSWHDRNAGHPATVLLPELLAEIQEKRVERIALFLPANPALENVAVALLEGFLAAWYETPSAQRPQLDIHYTDEGNIGEAWQEATNAGASHVVGPLEKPVILKLLEYADDRIPILSLNRIDRSPGTHRAILRQLGLGTEEEVEQIAEYAWFSGYQKALVLGSNDAWGQRTMRAFHDYWERLGGMVTEQQSYAPGEPEYALIVKQLLNVDEGERRRQSLQSALGLKLHGSLFTRQDADFIFLASLPREASLILPQFRYFRAGDIPVFSTSLIHEGFPSGTRDLDGLMFIDIPWIGSLKSRLSLIQAKINEVRQIDSSAMRRLYALGVDAYRILPEIERMEKEPSYAYGGETGDLRMGVDGQIHRKLQWMRFTDGQPQPIQPPD